MVSPYRYREHHTLEAAKIEKLLNQFGHSGDTPGFWCKQTQRTTIVDCIKCPDYNICHNDPPPLRKRIKDNETGWKQYNDDMALSFLMDPHKEKSIKDWIWLQHPETR